MKQNDFGCYDLFAIMSVLFLSFCIPLSSQKRKKKKKSKTKRLFSCERFEVPLIINWVPSQNFSFD